MPYGKGTYGNKVGRPPKKKKTPNERTGRATRPVNSRKTRVTNNRSRGQR